VNHQTGNGGIGGINHSINKRRSKVIKYTTDFTTLLSHPFKFVHLYALHIPQMAIADIRIRIPLNHIQKKAGGGDIDEGINNIGVLLTSFTASNSRLKVNNRIPR
jgi:hypothetical protein